MLAKPPPNPRRGRQLLCFRKELTDFFAIAVLHFSNQDDDLISPNFKQQSKLSKFKVRSLIHCRCWFTETTSGIVQIRLPPIQKRAFQRTYSSLLNSMDKYAVSWAGDPSNSIIITTEKLDERVPESSIRSPLHRVHINTPLRAQLNFSSTSSSFL
jgi:hypothetical protein